jgi:hypothetical protein
MLERSLAGTLNDRTIGERIAKRDSELDHACTCVDGCENHLARGGKIGIAASYVGDQRRLVFEVERHASIVDVESSRVLKSVGERFRRQSLLLSRESPLLWSLKTKDLEVVLAKSLRNKDVLVKYFKINNLGLV